MVRSEMLPFSGNNQNIIFFGVPPEHLAIGYVHTDNLPLLNNCITICHSKQLHECLVVFSDDFLHFLKIKKECVETSAMNEQNKNELVLCSYPFYPSSKK